MAARFRVGITRDFLKADGSLGFGDIGLALLDEAPDVDYEFLAEGTRELRADQIAGYDGLLVLAPDVTAATLAGADRLAIVARFGVGYDNVDVAACTERGVALTITPDGVRRPMAAANMTMLLALTHRLIQKDRLTRAGRWADKLDYMGQGVTGRTLGLIGLGNIGRELVRLAHPFGLRCIAYDPFLQPADVSGQPVELIDLEGLLATSDYVAICCALTPETHHLINAERLALMRPTSYLLNLARGPIVDQQALYQVLQRGAIAGAGLDVFDQEPVDPNEPILTLDNVILAPHGICWTDETFRGNGESACRSLLAIARGELPGPIVNRAVVDTPSFRRKLAAFGQARSSSNERSR